MLLYLSTDNSHVVDSDSTRLHKSTMITATSSARHVINNVLNTDV